MAAITISLTLSPNELKRILRILGEGHDVSTEAPVNAGTDTIDETAEHSKPLEGSSTSFERWGRELAQLLSEGTEKVLRFVVARNGEVNNDDLAHHLGFANAAYTSSLLGKVTWALRKIGVQAEGRSGNNWYRNKKVRGKTVLFVRADVLDIFKAALTPVRSH